MKFSPVLPVLMLTATTALFPLTASAATVRATGNTDTDVSTATDTLANSGVNVETGARVNGGIRTGDSTARTDVDTDVSTDVNTTANSDTRVSSDIRERRRQAVIDDSTRAERIRAERIHRADADVDMERERHPIAERRMRAAREDADDDHNDRRVGSADHWDNRDRGQGRKVGHARIASRSARR